MSLNGPGGYLFVFGSKSLWFGSEQETLKIKNRYIKEGLKCSPTVQSSAFFFCEQELYINTTLEDHTFLRNGGYISPSRMKRKAVLVLSNE